MDLTDKKILCELDLNCRAPLSAIAKRLRIGRNVVEYRMGKLEESGILRKYVCALNLGKLGYKTYKIYFKTRNNKELEGQFVDALSAKKEVIHLLKTEGMSDYSATVAVKDVAGLDETLTEIKSAFKELITEYQVSILINSERFKLQKLLLDEKQPVPSSAKYSVDEKSMELDEGDRKLLKTLSQQARIPLVDLAANSGLGVDAAKHRLKRLGSELIQAYRTVLDMNKLGYHHYILLLKTKPTSKSDDKRLAAWCTMRKNVMFYTKNIGRHDYEINFAITGIDDLNRAISDIKTEFGGIIDSYETLINSRLLKLDYVPF